MTMSSLTQQLERTMRWLEEEAEEEVVVMVAGKPSDEYASFGGDDDDEGRDDYIFQTWEFWLIVMVASIFLCLVIFYFSYKQELCCGIHKNGTEEDVEGEADIEKGKKLATKTFQDSKAFDRLPEQEVEHHMNASSKQLTEGGGSSDTTGTSSGRSQSTTNSNNNSKNKPSSNMHTLITVPRCVLCSKPFEIGENVTHSTACHHEFHEDCLKKFWVKNNNNKKKNNNMNGKCPICKVEYVVEELSPSKHFSSHMSESHKSHTDGGVGTRTGAGGQELGPFEEIEEDSADDNNKDA